ncbi:MAG: hypothetical protein OEQ53_19985, partial [Saprospiraceae bacterium]|nr:hypothetical protein [Saprospiraceae bacterium]
MKSRVARYILMLNSSLMILYGLGVILLPNLITDNLEIYSALNWIHLREESPLFVEYIVRLVFLLGVFNILLGSSGLIAVYQSFHKKGKWLLAIILLTNILGYLAPVLFDLTTGVITYIEVIEMISFTLAVISILIIMPEFTN